MVEMISKEFWLTSTSTPSMEYVRKSFYRYEINGILKHSTHLNFFKENRAHKVLDTFSDPKPPWLIRRGQHTWNGQKGDSEGFEAAGNLVFWCHISTTFRPYNCCWQFVIDIKGEVQWRIILPGDFIQNISVHRLQKDPWSAEEKVGLAPRY